MRLLVCLLALGCTSEGTPPARPDASRAIADLGRLPDAGVVDAAPPRPDAAPPPDAAVVDASPRDAAPPVCAAGERVCGEEGGDQVFVCLDGAFSVEPCLDGTVCEAGVCIDPLEGCVIGEPACLGIGQPARCVAGPRGGVLEPVGAPCTGDDVCLGGRCLTQACAGAGRAYVGCEYWFTDLPSFRYSGPEGDSVRGAPLGLVVMNPDSVEETQVWLYGPDGGPGAILPAYEVTPPVDDDLPMEVYRPRRIRSQVKAADGSVPRGGFAEAQGVRIPPGGVGTFLVPHTALPEQTSHIRAAGWRLVADRPVVAYQFNPLCCNYSFSADASLLLPRATLGQRYRMVGQPAQGGIVGGLSVVATEDETVVTVWPGQTRVALDPDRRVALDIEGKVQVVLQAHEVLTLAARNGPYPVSEKDLSGALVESTAPIAAFTWHQCAQVPGALDACDHLEEQLFPVEAWGQRYVLVPLADRGRPRPATEVNYWKLVAELDDTRIRLSVPFADLDPLPVSQLGGADCQAFLTAPDEVTLGAGESCEFGTSHPVALDATSPSTSRTPSRCPAPPASTPTSRSKTAPTASRAISPLVSWCMRLMTS